jgi:hypothetical protein
MTTVSRDASLTPLEAGERRATVEFRPPRRPVETREDFRRWLKRILREIAERPSERPISAVLSACSPQFWEVAFDGVGRFCPQSRAELETIARSLFQSMGGSEETRQSWEQLIVNLRTLYAVTANPAERDADRLEEYLENFSSRGQKAMVAELWTKGSASYQRLTNLRGQYSVTANADRNAIDRLVAKAELLWAKERQIRITKSGSGLVLEKSELHQQETEIPPPEVNTSS